MSRIAFPLACTPTAPQRTRHTCTGRTYKAESQQANERTLETLLLAHKPISPLEGPLVLEFVAHLPAPKSRTKKTVEGVLCGKIGHTSKPDLDNLVKHVKDCLTMQRFWVDDKNVVGYLAGTGKYYSDRPRWEIEIVQVQEVE